MLFGGNGEDFLSGDKGEKDMLFGENDDDALDGGEGTMDFCDQGNGIPLTIPAEEPPAFPRNCEVFPVP